MFVGAGTEAVNYLPKDTEAHAVITELGRFGIDEITDNDTGRRVMRAHVKMVLIDGEFADHEEEYTIWIRADEKGGYGNNNAIQSLWTATGVQAMLGTNDDGKKIYPWPTNVTEAKDAIMGEGEYELKGLGLRGKVFKLVTGEPKKVTKKNRDGEEKTYTNTVIAQFRTPSQEDRNALQPIVEALMVPAGPAADDDDDMPF